VFTARRLKVTLRHRTTGETVSAQGGDLSTLPSQGTGSTRISVAVALPSTATTGDWDVLLSAPDIFPATAGNPRFAVRFANADNSTRAQAWDGTAATFRAGTTLRVQ
jgi:hypothetical protein